MKRNYSLRLLPLFILVGLLQLTASSSQAQAPSLIWQHCYGGDSSDEFTCIKPTPDGGFIAAGDTRSSDGDLSANGGIKGLWVVKMDAEGNVQWERTYSDTLAGANYIEQTYDGGYVLTGAGTLKLDAAGNIQWTRNFFGYVVHQSVDSGYVIANEYSVVKLNSNGNIQWQHSYMPVGDQLSILDICVADNNNGYIITGAMSDIFECSYIAHIDDSGTILSIKYNLLEYGSGSAVCKAVDGHYLWLLNLNETEYIEKVDSSLDSDWQISSFNGNSGARTIAATSDNGFITWGFTATADEMTLTKYDSLGNHQWIRQISGSSGDISTSACETADGKYVVTGIVTTNAGEISGIHGGEDAWTALLGGNTAVPAVKNGVDVKIYPLPATNAVYVDMPEGYNNASLSLSDISGNIVAADNNTSLHRSIDLSHMAAGTYLLTVTNNGTRSSYKVTHY